MDLDVIVPTHFKGSRMGLSVYEDSKAKYIFNKRV
jgi:hypothetical protein